MPNENEASGHRQSAGLERRVIGLWRTSIAHLHRPWRAGSEYAIGAKPRRFLDPGSVVPHPMRGKAGGSAALAANPEGVGR